MDARESVASLAQKKPRERKQFGQNAGRRFYWLPGGGAGVHGQVVCVSVEELHESRPRHVAYGVICDVLHGHVELFLIRHVPEVVFLCTCTQFRQFHSSQLQLFDVNGWVLPDLFKNVCHIPLEAVVVQRHRPWLKKAKTGGEQRKYAALIKKQ